MAGAVIVIIVGVAVAVAVVIAAAVIMAPGKGSGENLKKSSPRRKERFSSGFPVRNGARVGVTGVPINILPV